MSCVDKKDAGATEGQNQPSGRRRVCAVQAFRSKAKTLAQGKFISPEHVKSPPVSIKITTPNGVVIFMEYRNTIDAAASGSTSETKSKPSAGGFNLEKEPRTIRCPQQHGGAS